MKEVEEVINKELQSIKNYFLNFKQELTPDQAAFVRSYLRVAYHSGAIAAIKEME